MTTHAVPILVIDDEIAAACEAMRYQASDMSTVATAHRQREVNALRRLAEQFEARYRAAVDEAARVDAGEEQ